MRRPIAGIVLGVLTTLLLVSPASALRVGQKAPEFELAGPGGAPVRLSQLLGKGPVVVYTFVRAFNAT